MAQPIFYGGFPRIPSIPPTPEDSRPPTKHEMLVLEYNNLGFDALFIKYAMRETVSDENPRFVAESDIDEALHTYADFVSPLAMETGEPDIPLIRTAFDTIIHGMNVAASEKLGYKRPKTTWGRVMQRVGINDPEVEEHFRGLDDRYWERQFPEEYQEQKWDQRLPDEDDTHYLARHIYRSFRGFALAPFSYIQQATHSAR